MERSWKNEDHLLQKYIGTLIGCLAGDCLGIPFEFSSSQKFIPMVHQIAKQIKSEGFTRYSDDTALTRATCESLIQAKRFNPVLLAEKLIDTFHENPHRGYASGAKSLFCRMKDHREKNYQDFVQNPFKEPMNLFDGSGSMGNGCGMRVSPIALLTKHLSVDAMTLTCALAVSLTHANEVGVIGGLQQCYAVRLALINDIWSIKESFYDEMFDKVIGYVEDFEKNGLAKINDRNREDHNKICENYQHFTGILLRKNVQNSKIDYLGVLKRTRQFYERIKGGEIMNLEEFHLKACNCGVKAHESVPVALFAFVVASNQLCEKEVDAKLGLTGSFSKLKPMERVILYAIALGGDTDTIGSMAGAIAGAFYGFYKNYTLSANVVTSCESFVKIGELGFKFYSLVYANDNERVENSSKEDLKDVSCCSI